MKTVLIVPGFLLSASLALHSQTLAGFTFNSSDTSFSYNDSDDPGAVVT